MMRNLLLAGVLLIAAAPAVRAQDPAPPAPAAPMTLERVYNSWIVGPDLKFTQFDRTTATLVGVRGGYLLDNTLLFGAAAYWQTNGGRNQSLGYGGPLVQWTALRNHRVGVAVSGLAGWGSSTLTSTIVYTPPPPFPLPTKRDFTIGPAAPGLAPITSQVRFDQGFFVAEPQANVTITLNRWARLDTGFGYRVVGGAASANRVQGMTGSIGLQIGSAFDR
jgi:hypothetical protein